MSTTTYLQVVNDLIKEAGLDLAFFAVDGSDWTTNTNAMMQRFKGWVSTSWKDIQQNAYDLEFMEEIAVVNINPGVLFYTDSSAVSKFASALTNTKIDVFDQDNTTAIPQVPATSFVDLTGQFTETAPFGYFNVSATGTSQISWALKPAAEYFAVYTPTTYDTVHNTSYTGAGLVGYVNNVSNFTPMLDNNHALIVTVTVSGVDYNVTLTAFSQAGITYEYNAASGAAAVNTASTTNAPFVMKIGNNVVGSFTGFSNTATGNTNSGVFTASPISKAFVHGWKSFNFAEESGKPDFLETIQEIDQQSFRMVDYYNPAPSGEYPLQFMEWESFNKIYDLSSTLPGLPRLITEDNTGRWRLYPHPYYNVTLKFDYDRVPQIVSAFDDTFKGLPDDFTDLVKWKALIYYGEYDEQPSVATRGTKYYKTMLSRFETKFREKFHFKPHRMW